MEYIFAFSALPVYVQLFASIIGLIGWKRLSPAFKILVVFIIVCFITEIVSRIVAYVYRNNLPLLHLYTFTEVLVLSLFYKKILDKSSLFIRYFKWIAGGVLLAIILNSVFIQPLLTFNSIAKTIGSLLLILLGIDYAFRLSDQKNIQYQKEYNWINSGLLIYYSGSLFIYMSSEFHLNFVHSKVLMILWNFNTLLNLILHLIIIIILWKVIFRRQTLSSSPPQVS